MSGPKEPDQGNPTLGPKKEAPVKAVGEWRFYKPGFEINQRGQLRTVPRQ